MTNAYSTIPGIGNVYGEEQLRGRKQYELSNHLGNVLVTVSDKKKYNVGGWYEADVISAQDYYPGGLEMPGRSITTTSGYRYGFNGKENDPEVAGQQDYGFRIYDKRIVRFKSVDPLTKQYPELTPYQFASNKPINSIDLDGLESKEVHMIFDVNGKEIFHLEKDVNNPYGLGKGTAYNVTFIQEVDYKQINKSRAEVTRRALTMHAYVPPPMTSWEMIKDKIGGFFQEGKETGEQFGYQIYGSGMDGNWNDRLIKGKPGSESIDMGEFLGLIGGLRNSVGAKDVVEDFSRNQSFIKFVQKIDQIKDAGTKTADAVDGLNDANDGKRHYPNSAIWIESSEDRVDRTGIIIRTDGKGRVIDTIKHYDSRSLQEKKGKVFDTIPNKNYKK